MDMKVKTKDDRQEPRARPVVIEKQVKEAA